MINMIRLNDKAFDKSNTLAQIFAKTFNTISKQCQDLGLDKIAVKMHYYYTEVSIKMIIEF